MCTRYISPEAGDIERHWHVGARDPMRWASTVEGPLSGREFGGLDAG